MQQIKKITVKTVHGKVEKPKKDTLLMRVIGVVHGVRTGSTQYGDFVAFRGAFKGIRLSDGEVFSAGQCLLPDCVSDTLAATIMQSDVKSADFAFDIGVKPADNAVGYEYYAASLVKASETDPLAALEARITAALPAPAK